MTGAGLVTRLLTAMESRVVLVQVGTQLHSLTGIVEELPGSVIFGTTPLGSSLDPPVPIATHDPQ
jgi:hypothetical protein